MAAYKVNERSSSVLHVKLQNIKLEDMRKHKSFLAQAFQTDLMPRSKCDIPQSVSMHDEGDVQIRTDDPLDFAINTGSTGNKLDSENHLDAKTSPSQLQSDVSLNENHRVGATTKTDMLQETGYDTDANHQRNEDCEAGKNSHAKQALDSERGQQQKVNGVYTPSHTGQADAQQSLKMVREKVLNADKTPPNKNQEKVGSIDKKTPCNKNQEEVLNIDKKPNKDQEELLNTDRNQQNKPKPGLVKLGLKPVQNTKLVVVLVSFLSMGQTIATGQQPLTFDRQILPAACTEYLKKTNCPVIGFDNYAGINKKCCGEIPGTVLHCQSNGTLPSVSCMPNTTVAKGMYIKIVKKDGLPYKVTHHCDKDHYEPNDRGSNSVIHPYCTKRKTKCSEKLGQQRLCKGGPTRDDQCQCRQGYQSDCSRGFTQHDACSCQKAECPDGTERKSSYKSDSELDCPIGPEIHLNYSCVIITTTEISSTPNTSLSTPNTSLLTPEPKPRPTSNSSDDGRNTDDGYTSNYLALLIISAAAVVFFLYQCNRKFREAVNSVWNYTCTERADRRPRQKQVQSAAKYKRTNS